MSKPQLKKRSKAGPLAFGKRLTALMTDREVGVREAARMAEIAPSVIVSWRSGSSPEDFIALRRLARELKTTLSFLLTGEEETRGVGVTPAISEVFEDGGDLFSGFAEITIRRLLPRGRKAKEL